MLTDTFNKKPLLLREISLIDSYSLTWWFSSNVCPCLAGLYQKVDPKVREARRKKYFGSGRRKRDAAGGGEEPVNGLISAAGDGDGDMIRQLARGHQHHAGIYILPSRSCSHEPSTMNEHQSSGHPTTPNPQIIRC